MARPEGLDGPDDLGLVARPDAALPEHGLPVVRGRVGPVELDDLARQLGRRDHRGRDAPGRRLLDAEVEDGGEERVLVGGGEAAQLEDGEDLLGQRQRLALALHGTSFQ